MANDNPADGTDPDDRSTFELSRRKILAGISGGVGGGVVLGGGATWTLLQDRETLANNRLVTGELDAKVTWQQTYNGEPVNAFPDENDDGVRDDVRTREEIANDAGLPVDSPSVETAFREQFADLPDDVAAPVIDLQDVKAGDEGSVEIGVHLFDNPGRVSIGGELLESAENGLNEAEEDVIDAIGGDEGELADVIRAELLDANGDSLFAGSLRDTMFHLSTCGAPIGAVQNSSTEPVELNWQVPEGGDDAGVQTDSVKFDLSIHAEQLRHNQPSAVAGSHLNVSKKVRRVGPEGSVYQDKILAEPPGQEVGNARFRLRIENPHDRKDTVCVFINFAPDDVRAGPFVDDGDEGTNENGCLELEASGGAPAPIRQDSNKGGLATRTTISFPGQGGFESGISFVFLKVDMLPQEVYKLFADFELNPGLAHCNSTTINGAPKDSVSDGAIHCNAKVCSGAFPVHCTTKTAKVQF